MKPKLLMGNGHGADKQTNGKYSPIVTGLGFGNDPSIIDNRFREGNGNRLIAADIVRELKSDGYDAILTAPEANDISISERVRRVNHYCKLYGAQNCLLVEIHANTAGNDANNWSNARGWLSIVDDYASVKAKDFAGMLYDAVKEMGLPTRRPNTSRDYYYYRELIGKSVRLPILSKTACPAVLTENFFYTNKEDLKLLATPEGRAKIVKFHVEAIKRYVEKYF